MSIMFIPQEAGDDESTSDQGPFGTESTARPIALLCFESLMPEDFRPSTAGITPAIEQTASFSAAMSVPVSLFGVAEFSSRRCVMVQNLVDVADRMRKVGNGPDCIQGLTIGFDRQGWVVLAGNIPECKHRRRGCNQAWKGEDRNASAFADITDLQGAMPISEYD